MRQCAEPIFAVRNLNHGPPVATSSVAKAGSIPQAPLGGERDGASGTAWASFESTCAFGAAWKRFTFFDALGLRRVKGARSGVWMLFTNFA